MPELPDVTVYVEGLRERLIGRRLLRMRISSPFVLRTFEPAAESVEDQVVRSIERVGKRIVVGFGDDLFVVVHLMIAGRLLWADAADQSAAGGPAVQKAPFKRAGKFELAQFTFENGSLTLTEAGTQKRAAIHVLSGREAVEALNAGGVEPMEASYEKFAAAMRHGNHTLKRSLTDPRVVAGIGNAYSDEILYAARLSPFKMTGSMRDEEMRSLWEAMQRVLGEWTQRLREEFGGRFPRSGEITAFRPEFAVHGKFGKPCPVCGTKVQRIVYAQKNDMNYCPTCQTEGRVLADRSLSRLLRDDWPKTVEEMEG